VASIVRLHVSRELFRGSQPDDYSQFWWQAPPLSETKASELFCFLEVRIDRCSQQGRRASAKSVSTTDASNLGRQHNASSNFCRDCAEFEAGLREQRLRVSQIFQPRRGSKNEFCHSPRKTVLLFSHPQSTCLDCKFRMASHCDDAMTCCTLRLSPKPLLRSNELALSRAFRMPGRE
jgi:hypothetical protein